MLANYQSNKIEKTLRHFLWSDGLGNSKRHNVKWEWCFLSKKLGGLGMRDINKQGTSLATKWVLKSLEGGEPWKILVYINIIRATIKKGKLWDNVPLMDIVFGDFEVKVTGSKVFQSIWKAWVQVRPLIQSRYVVGKSPYYSVKDRSLWWGVYLNGKPLALTQCCSARSWNKKGISLIQDVIVGHQMGSWEDIKSKFNIPNTEKKTFTLVSKVVGSHFLGKILNSDQFIEQLRWQDGKLLNEFSSK